MGNVIEFRNITKYFPGVKALDDISFTANGGEVLALMGENGAGKSTLLRCSTATISRPPENIWSTERRAILIARGKPWPPASV